VEILEFEAWVSDNYDELAKRARIATKFQDEYAEPVLHQVVEYVLESPDKRIPKRGDLFAWFYSAMEMTHRANMRGRYIRDGLDEQILADIETLGQDEAFADTRRASEANRHIRKQSNVKAEGLESLAWDGPMPGVARWRFQTLRDNRLFDERAVRSIAESMHKASSRIRHDGEPGFSFTEFGRENAR
jgi:hypothetical protein